MKMYWNSWVSVFLVTFLISLSFSITASPSSHANDDIFEPSSVVLSPTRLKQPLKDIPASVTIIKYETLISLGIQDIPEALRLVPGFSVGYASGNEPRITYHGGSGLIPRRLQVLIDGMPIYRGGYAKIDWSSIPVSIEDVERIVVTRSPSSATYGANSFQAVVSIETKKTKTTVGNDLILAFASNGKELYSGQHSNQIGDTTFRLRLEKNRDSGFDKNFVDDDRRDSESHNKLILNTQSALSHNSNLEVMLSAVESDLDSEFIEPRQITFPDIKTKDYYFHSAFTQEFNTSNELKVQLNYNSTDLKQHWYACHPTILFSDELRAMQLANPAYAATIIAGGMPSGGTAEDDILAQDVFAKFMSLGSQALAPTCARANQDGKDSTYNVDIQHTYIHDNDLRFVGGAGFLYNEFESNSYVNGTAYNSNIYFFSNMEYHVNKFVFNTGIMAEKDGNGSTGIEYSPRLSINYHIDPKQTLRFIYSKSIRTPDVLENQRDWSYPVTDLSYPVNGRTTGYFYFNAKADGNLVSEKIESKEISYFTSLPEYRLTLDVKLFHETMWDLISEKLQFFDYQPSNIGWITNHGVEVQANITPRYDWTIGTGYTYLDSETNSFFEKMMSAKHSGSFYATHHFKNGYDASITYFGSENISGTSFDLLGLTISKIFVLNNKSKMRVRAKVSHQREDSSFISSETFSVENNYDESFHFGVDLALQF